MMKKIQLMSLCLYVVLFSVNGLAAENEEFNFTAPDPQSKAAVDQRLQKESLVEENPFAITFFRQNYFLPYYYTGSPYEKIYFNQTPPNTRVKNNEIKFQLSLKIPIWKEILGSYTSLYFGYTQLSYWQAYNKHAFFRETDFQPEIFFSHWMCVPLFGSWKIDNINLGFVHESNGFGDSLERSWNRVYLEAVSSSDHFIVSVRPWYVVKDATYRKFNPHMANYLGYGEVLVGYKFANQVITLQTHNLIEGGGRHATAILSYSFPLTRYLNGFIQAFSGYGQSLIEYNHRTNSIGFGIALSNII